MPKLLKTPFAVDAAEGFRTDIQESTGAAPNSATYQIGFPPNTMQSITAGGVPPKGSDLNGVLYDITDNLVFLTQGGGYGFDAAYATSIGGYPLNAMLHLANGDIVKSTIDGNTNDPNIDMTGWFVPYMRGSQNLAELTDKAVARTNLGVYSKSETDSIAATPNATEAIAGKAKIATTAIAQAGTNDTDFLTAKKLRDALNASGNAPVYTFRALAQGNSDAVSPVLTRKLNISTASKINDQVLSFTFTTAMPDNNYTVLGFGSDNAIGTEGSSGGLIGFDQTTTGFKVKYSFAAHAASQSIISFRLVVL